MGLKSSPANTRPRQHLRTSPLPAPARFLTTPHHPAASRILQIKVKVLPPRELCAGMETVYTCTAQNGGRSRVASERQKKGG